MLERLEVGNYKCLVGFGLDFDELTLLVGVNGAGKSSVLEVVWLRANYCLAAAG